MFSGNFVISKEGKKQTFEQLANDYFDHFYQQEWFEDIEYELLDEAKKRTGKEKKLLKYLSDNFDIIITATPKKMKEIIAEVEKFEVELFEITKAKGKDKCTEIGNKILALFKYEYFRSDKAVWLSEQLNIKTCVYCNAQYLNIIKKKEEKEEKIYLCFTLDHFYPKSKYPYLSISPLNLIPICSSCNQLKSDMDILSKPFPHPYYDSIPSLFTICSDKVNLVKHILNNSEPKITLVASTKVDEKDKATNFLDLYNIESIYENHTEIVKELYWKKICYSKGYKDWIIKTLKDKNISLSISQINRFITGNYTDEKDFHKRPLSKLTHDIAEELGLLP